jgi:hypothetical protein
MIAWLLRQRPNLPVKRYNCFVVRCRRDNGTESWPLLIPQRDLMQDVGPEVSAHVPAVLPCSCGTYYFDETLQASESNAL